MSASPRAIDAPLIAARFDALAFVLLAVLPLGMALLNKSAQPILAAAAVSALAARALSGGLADMRDRLASLLSTPIGLGIVAFFIYAAVSMTWSHHLKNSVSAYAEIAAAFGTVLILHAALPREVPGWAVKLATIAFAIGCLTIVSELATGLAMRGGLGLRSQTFIFKRSVAAMLTVLWPLAGLLWLSGRASLAVALGVLLAVATYAAHSSATAVGMAVGLGAIGLALWSRLLVARLIAGALLIAFLIAPFQGDVADRFVPAQAVGKLDFAHAQERIDIWQSFGEVVKRRPVLGTGFGTSPVMNKEPVAQEVPENRRLMLGAWHPHNAYLQIWAELGLVGVLIAAATLVTIALALGRMDRQRAAIATAIMASAAAIMTVGHGVWQGWWATMIGAAIVWLARLAVSPGAPSRSR